MRISTGDFFFEHCVAVLECWAQRSNWTARSAAWILDRWCAAFNSIIFHKLISWYNCRKI